MTDKEIHFYIVKHELIKITFNHSLFCRAIRGEKCVSIENTINIVITINLVSDLLSHLLPFFFHLAMFFLSSLLSLPNSLLPLSLGFFFLLLVILVTAFSAYCSYKIKKDIYLFIKFFLQDVSNYAITISNKQLRIF